MEKRLETKQMRLTKETLKRIIKEEMSKVLHEEQADYQDAIEAAKAELERNSYSTDGFEEKALGFDKEAEYNGSVDFEFNATQTTYSGVEPGEATFTITLTTDGKYAISDLGSTIQ